MYPAKLISGPLQTERLEDGRRKLLRDLIVEVDGEAINIPMNFTTDYSSIPVFASWIVRWSRVDIAGVVHDYVYRIKKYSRHRADAIWYKVAISGEHRANRLQAIVCWAGLRLFGWFFYYGLDFWN